MLTWSMMSALLLLPLTLASVRAICLAMFYLECTGFVAILAGEACSAVEICWEPSWQVLSVRQVGALPACLAAHRRYAVILHNVIAWRASMLPQVFFYFYFITNHKTTRKVTAPFSFRTSIDTNLKTDIINVVNRIFMSYLYDFTWLFFITTFCDAGCGYCQYSLVTNRSPAYERVVQVRVLNCWMKEVMLVRQACGLFIKK